MSDTSFSSLCCQFRNIDVVDEDWILDCLSDDEIDLPDEFQMVLDLIDEEDHEMDDMDPLTKKDEWDDNGMDRFIADAAAMALIQSPVESADVAGGDGEEDGFEHEEYENDQDASS
jgi:hypothetical protein